MTLRTVKDSQLSRCVTIIFLCHSRNVVVLDFILFMVFAMKFIYIFYNLGIVLTKMLCVARDLPNSVEIDDTELKLLSIKLNPIECLRLLEAVYLKKPMMDDEFERSEKKIPLDDESVLRRQLERPILSHENCRVKLEEWSRNLPEKSNRWARVAMENVLRTLGRPDLAKYIKRNRRVVQYFEGDSKLHKNAAKHSTASRTFVPKPVQVTPVVKKYLPKEAVLQFYRTPEETKVKDGKSTLENGGEVAHAHGRSRKFEDANDADDSATRWTAFLILLGIVALTILATAIFGIYKKKRGRIFSIGDKNREFDDCCPLANRLIGTKPSIANLDIENGGSTVSSRCARKKRRGSSTQEPSRSPSSICMREKCAPSRKPRIKNFLKDKQQQTRKLMRSQKNRCDKNCAGIAKEKTPSIPKIDKSTKTKPRKTSEKSHQITNPAKPRLELKKFHEKLANILRKDNPCKCCKCSVCVNGDKNEDTKVSGKKNICSDETCQKRRLKSIAELCFSSEELSTRNESEEDSNRKNKIKKRQKKPKDRDKDADNEKESAKTSPENSPRSKDRRDSKVTEKNSPDNLPRSKDKRDSKAPEKASPDDSPRSKDKRDSKVTEKTINKRRKCDADEACTRKTCTFRKSRVKADSIVEKNNV